MVAALVVAGLGELVRRLIIRKWPRLYLNPKTACFPRICPVCLSSNADSSVDEKSAKRQTRNYIVAQKLEWWRAGVPHCSECALKLSGNKAVGLILGGACTVATLLARRPPELSILTFCYILFGYPAYAIATTIHKGIVFGRASSSIMCVHVRHAEYLKLLAALNPVSYARAE